jgi:hypothetical protein
MRGRNAFALSPVMRANNFVANSGWPECAREGLAASAAPHLRGVPVPNLRRYVLKRNRGGWLPSGEGRRIADLHSPMHKA